MQGGSSKGLFFLDNDLPQNLMAREALLLRILSNYGISQQQSDGSGGATSFSNQVAIVKASARPDCDIDYTFGAVAAPVTDQSMRIDWTNNCSHLTAAVGPFAVAQGLVPATDGYTKVRIWQVNLGKRIDAYVPADAEIRLDFIDPAEADLLPTSNLKDWLAIPSLGKIAATLMKVDSPIVFVRADALGLQGRQNLVKTPNKITNSKKQSKQLELVCVYAAVAMGLAHDIREAAAYPARLPTLCCLGKPAAYRTLQGADVAADAMDILAQHFSVEGRTFDFDGSRSMALGLAAAIPGTIANEIARTLPGIATRIGHDFGVLTVGADVNQDGNLWRAEKVTISRSARCLMSGWVHLG